MSDQSQGPGWWLASDGKWYPPDAAPAVPPTETWGGPPSPGGLPPTGPPPSSGMSSGAKTGLIVGLSVVGLLVVAVVAFLLLGEESDDSGTDDASGEVDDGGSGDGGDGSPTSADLPDGYELIEGDGVSIGVPDTWSEIAPEDFAMTPEELEQAFPDAPEGMVESFSGAFAQGALLVAFEPSLTFGSNVNILRIPGEVPLDDVERDAPAELGTFGASGFDVSRTSLPLGEAVRVGYDLQVVAPDGNPAPASGVQFYVPHDGGTYIITVTSDEGVDELADTMAETFTVG